ncbi:MAG: hypothetical protein ACTSU3_08345 [Candidatus Thorarchaeota archaeon]
MNISGRQKGLLIRIDSSSIEFPDICPICGERATHHRLISRSNRNKLKSRTTNYYWGRRTGSKRSISGETRRLRIPVCDKHYQTIDEMSRIHSLTGLLAGVSVLLFGIVGVIIAFHLYDRIPLPFSGYFVILLITLVMVGSLKNLGPDELQRAISIVDFHHHGHIVILKIRDQWYGEDILRMNASSAQAVRNTTKSKFE